MKRQLIFGTMLSATLAVGVAAQQPPASGATSPAGQPPSDRASQSLTLTGCLKDAPGGAGGATTGGATTPGGATAGASQAGGFILTDAKPAGSMAGGATAPGAATGTTGAGAAGTTGSASAQSTYRLTGGESQNLKQYVGQKVEVTGTAASASSSGSPSSPGGSPSSPGAPAGSPGAEKSTSGSGQGPALRVTTVRPTGDKCN